MKSRYELTISTDYVPNWTYEDGLRELFQNAIDNEIVNQENKMSFAYSNGAVTITNKTSVLEADTLLLGSSTKRDDKRTIGQHGEGYKIAFMVLLREGKTITVYNYGKREIWNVRLVKSRRFNGKQVPIIEIEKEAFWKKVPDDNLTIEVKGITEEEYNKYVNKNLHLRKEYRHIKVSKDSSILLDKSEKGNIYIRGLFVCNKEGFKYGYDLSANDIRLDRDRKLVDSFDLSWETSYMWLSVYNKGKHKKDILSMINDNSLDTRYVESRIKTAEVDLKERIGNDLRVKFKEQHGEGSIAIAKTSDIALANRLGLKPIIVREEVLNLMNYGVEEDNTTVISNRKVSDKLRDFMDDIEDKLTDTELKTLKDLIQEVEDME